jgi:hypothetical protein
MEDSMYKGFIVIAATLSIVSLGSVLSDRAQAGGATSAASKYSSTIDGVKQAQLPVRSSAQTADFAITEFSSSSAKSSVAKR